MASHKRVHTTATSRLRQDYLRIVKDPVPYITALPLPSNILEWFVRFVLQIILRLHLFSEVNSFTLLFSCLLIRLVFYCSHVAGTMSLEVQKIHHTQVARNTPNEKCF